jgi:DNA-binding transcriptional ArsR family regulator
MSAGEIADDAAQLRDLLTDVPQATLYRHIAILVEAGFLAVASERRVRGTIERTYTLGERMAHVEQAELATLSDEQIRAGFLAFIGEAAGKQRVMLSTALLPTE